MNCKNCMFRICWQPSNKFRVTAFIDEIDNFSDSINSMKISNNADLNGETNLDVAGVCILEYKEILKIPNNLINHFPNMISLDMSGCGLTELSRNDLRNLQNLREIRLCQMSIENLPADLFFDLKNIEIIELQKNKINFIEKQTFEGFKKLNYVDLRGNPKINAIYATKNFEIEENLNVARLLRLSELNGLIQVYFHSNSGETASTLEVELNSKEISSNEVGSSSSSSSTNENESNPVCGSVELKSWVESKPSTSGSSTEITSTSNLDEIKTFKESTKVKSEYDCQNSICHDIQQLLKCDEFRNFTISVSDTKFKVHKFILAARSPTFAEMIKNNPDADELCLHNVGVEIFEIILDYIYNEKMPEEFDDFSARVFAAAGKLKLEALKIHVGGILCGIIDPENCRDLLTLGQFYNHEELKKKSLEMAKKNQNKISDEKEIGEE